ncbi:hypothetical protein [Gorillibacterium massiliense]|uniref:hypothetical protein n=1 Tax=Gorillibacterium massiliense TaxID=1280390 RepID=UPI0004AE5EBA|nr:hypothetical protein [Gorillibacterium massiliense]
MTEQTNALPLWAIILVGVLLLGQGTWLFLDARGRSRYPWLWGIWGLIQCPTPFVVYLFVVRKAGARLLSKLRGNENE